MAAWRVARSLDGLLAQLNTLAPRRSKASDGSIGDAAHASRSSDHNPWLKISGQALVTARDFTHDPKNGLDCNKLADSLVKAKDPRVKYIIWNRRIIDSRPGNRPWQWVAYNGSNPHDKHLHLSVMDNASCESPAAWALPGLASAPAPTQEDDMYDADRARWVKLEADLRGDLAKKQKQLDQLTADVAAIKAAVLPKKA